MPVCGLLTEETISLKTRITQLLHIHYPVLQGGLAHLAYADLAAAVSNAGGLGQVTATSLANPEELRKEIRDVKRLTQRPFGVNFAISEYRAIDSMLKVALEEQVPIVTLTGGNPAPLMPLLRQSETKVLVLVSSVRQAKHAEELGADAVIAVGQEGGGHIGRDDVGSLVLTASVVDAVSIPVVASGGFADGRGLVSALSLGADGIEMGTRFVATQECRASQAYKDALLATPADGTKVVQRSVGTPARVLPSAWVQKILEVEQEQPEKHILYPLVARENNVVAAIEGRMQEGYAYAGQSAAFIHDIPAVSELMQRLIAEAYRSFDRIDHVMNE